MPDEHDGDARTEGRFGAEWPAKAADMVEMAVDGVFDKVVRPALVAIRAIVFGLVIAIMALVLLVALAIGGVRLLDVYAFSGRVWASDALVGSLLTVAGLVAWSFRRPRRADSH
jgi:hypothetical protein